MFRPAVYIVTNKKRGTLYIGVTSNLARRIYEHKEALLEGFTKKHGCKTLVYYEAHSNIASAIEREKKLKRLLRQKKIDLIESVNKNWEDKYSELL
jgi:putative endonuclease